MHARLTTIGLLALTLTVLSGCEAPPQNKPATPMTERSQPTMQTDPSSTLAQPVNILGRRSGDQGDLPHAGVWLIKNHWDLEESGSATIGRLGVDLARHDVVVVALGEQPTAGYAVEITAVQKVGDALYVQAKATQPSPNAMVTQQLTSPWTAVVIDNTTAAVAHLDVSE